MQLEYLISIKPFMIRYCVIIVKTSDRICTFLFKRITSIPSSQLNNTNSTN